MAKLPLITSTADSSGPTKITSIPKTEGGDSKGYFDTDTGKVVVNGLVVNSLSAGALTYEPSNLLASFSSDVNGYSQTVLQNKNAGGNAIRALVVSNDLGNDSEYYADLGITSSAYSNYYDAFWELPNSVFFTANGSQTPATPITNLNIGVARGLGSTNLFYNQGVNAYVFNTVGALSPRSDFTGGVLTTNFGTAGQVLASAGPDAPPQWVDQTGGGGGGGSGTVTSITLTTTGTGLTVSTGLTTKTITSSGTFTLGGTLGVGNGGTGASTLTLNAVLLGNGTSALTSVSLTDNQFLVGVTNGAPVGRTLAAGTGISIAYPSSVPTFSFDSTSSPTLAGLTLSGLTASRFVKTDASSGLTTVANIAASDFASQTANYFLAAPNGSSGTPTFRGIVAADLPDLSGTYLTVSTAASTYQTQSGMSSYLTTANAASTYLTAVDAGTTYLTQANAATTYAAKAGASFTGPVITPALTTSAAGFNITPTSATPTTLADGDIWTTSTGLFARINGATQQYVAVGSQPVGSQPYDVRGNFAGTPATSIVIDRFVANRTVTISTDTSLHEFFCVTPPASGTTVITVYRTKVGSKQAIFTATYDATTAQDTNTLLYPATIGTVSSSYNVISSGDLITVETGGSVNASLASLSWTIGATA